MRSLFAILAATLLFSVPSIAQQPVVVSETKKTETVQASPDISSPVKSAESKDSTAASDDIPAVVPIDRTAGTSSQNSWYKRPDGKTRSKRYLNSLFGVGVLVRTVSTAGINTWRNTPEEWGPTWEGFGRRVASNFSRGAIQNSIMFGLDEALKLDSHYYRSQKRDAKSKIVNALISPVTARKANGERTIGIPRIVGSYTAAVIATETWFPERYNYKDGLKSATISFGFKAGFNLFKEFIWKK